MTATIYSSCGLTDGLFYIKPSPYLGVLPVICSNEYAMIDGYLDRNLESLPQFLSSYDYERSSTEHILPNLDDTSTFREWFLPSDDDTKFKVAPDCLQCVDGQYGDNTAYHLWSGAYCFSTLQTSGCIDDKESYDYHPESCNQCDSGEFDDEGYWTRCYAVHLSSDYQPVHDHSTCVAHGLTFRPTISNVRDACTCFQSADPLLYPNNNNTNDDDDNDNHNNNDSNLFGGSSSSSSSSSSSLRISYQIPISDLPLITSSVDMILNVLHIPFIDDDIQFDPNWIEPKSADSTSAQRHAANDALYATDARSTNIVSLHQRDFENGTYRITKSGTYILMEDIILEFNGPSDEDMAKETFSPNGIDGEELYWFPTHDQAQREGAYPGLYEYEGAFTLGFFAGISVEAHFVKIDLNGFRMAQSERFYFQQRFFALIEMASQPFIPGQGPANWGADHVIYPSNIEITNGILDRSSHHGIHGLNNLNVNISHLRVSHFDIAGIQCNGCTRVVIRECTVGPGNMDIPVLGRYTHARSLLPRLTQLMREHGEEEITFHGRHSVTVSALIDRLTNQMDMVYHWYFDGVDYGEDDEDEDTEWMAAHKLFVNPSGWNDGGSSYGIAIGGAGANVIGIGARATKTSDITLENVEIFGIGNDAMEKMKFAATKGATRMIMFDAIDWFAVIDQVEDKSSTKYIGDAYTDLTFAIERVESSWYFLNSLQVTEEGKAFVFNGDNTAFQVVVQSVTPEFPSFSGCDTDIQLHSNKGAIGLRVDGVQNLNINGLYIHDVHNMANLGANWCGTYDGPTVGGEDIDIQYGYTATRSHGMVIDYVQGTVSNVVIEGIESFRGEANGLTVYKGCDVILDNVSTHSIRAGTRMSSDEVEELILPNLIPRACGVDIRENTKITTNVDGVGIVNGDDIQGFDTCDAFNHEEGMKGNYQTISEEVLIAKVHPDIESHRYNGNRTTIHVAAVIVFLFFGTMAALIRIVVQMNAADKERRGLDSSEYEILI